VGNGVCGQGVVEAKRAANGEGAVGDVVDFAGGPFFLAVVDEERPDFERGSLIGFGVGSCVGLRVRHLTEGTKGDGVDLRYGGKEYTRRRKCA
jgi:hypothetical protein